LGGQPDFGILGKIPILGLFGGFGGSRKRAVLGVRNPRGPTPLFSPEKMARKPEIRPSNYWEGFNKRTFGTPRIPDFGGFSGFLGLGGFPGNLGILGGSRYGKLTDL